MNLEKPPKGESEEDALKRVGHESVMRDLRAKYGLGNNTPLTPVEQLLRKRKELEDEVSRLPVARETYSEHELTQIININSKLNSFVSNFNTRFSGLDRSSPQYIFESQSAINEVIRYLDDLPVWRYKFSTEASGGNIVGEVEHSDIDSIYYMTESGISIRLKRSAVVEGYDFKTIIQPFMEKIFFRYGSRAQETMEGKPKLGLSVVDYCSTEFKERIKTSDKEGDFTSPLVVYIKEGKPFIVAGPDDMYVHNGDRVNKIF